MDSPISVREHFESILSERDKQTAQLAIVHAEAHKREHAMLQTAIDKSDESMNRRLEGMNEFRDSLRDQAARFATIVQLDERTAHLMSKVDASNTRIEHLEKVNANLEGRMWAIGVGFTLLTIMISLVLKFWR